MTSLLPILAMAMTIAITPGPNNFIVLNASSRDGWHAALIPIGAILTGATVLIVISLLGLGALVVGNPLIMQTITIGGAAYLAWIGFNLATSDPEQSLAHRGPLPIGFTPVALFQLFNPKSWVFVTTSTSAVLQTGGSAFHLIAILLGAAIIGLSIWASAGAALSRWLNSPNKNRLLNMSMGGALTLSALTLIWSGFR